MAKKIEKKVPDQTAGGEGAIDTSKAAGVAEAAPENAAEETTTAAPAQKLYYRGVLIVTPVEDVIHHGHPYKEFKIKTGESLKLAPGEFAEHVTVAEK